MRWRFTNLLRQLVFQHRSDIYDLDDPGHLGRIQRNRHHRVPNLGRFEDRGGLHGWVHLGELVMAMRGPQHARQAEDLLYKARFEKNETTKANLLAEAQVHATLALLAATVYTGSATKDQIQPWAVFGVKD